MEMSGEVLIPASREVVWAHLNDPAVLQKCIPGCESLQQEGDTLVASVKIKVGPVSAKFKGAVTLTDLRPPTSYKIVGQGEGGLAGFAKGSAIVELSEPEQNKCLLKYNVDASVGGKLAQLGSRMIDGVAKKNADQFFTTFQTIVSGQEA
jgi:hypothetical protein